MYNWEQIRSEVPFPQVYTVPTALERTGDFSQTRTADGRPVTIYDPLTTRLVNGQYVRDPFPGNRIPANRIDPVALAAAAAGAAAEHHRPGQQPARAGQRARRSLRPARAQGRSGDQRQPSLLRPLRPQQAHRDQRLRGVPAGSVALVSARPHERRASPPSTPRCCRPSLVLSSRAGFIRHDFYIADARRRLRPDDARVPVELRLAARSARRSRRSSGTATRTFGSTFGGNNGSVFTISDTWSWSEVLSKTTGNHSFKFGGEFRALINDQQNPTSSIGRFTFNRAFTQRNALARDASTPATRSPRCCSAIRPTARRRRSERVADQSRCSTIAATTSACSCRTTGASRG